MTTPVAPSLIGQGSPDLDLSDEELGTILEEALETVSSHPRVLAVIPDKTRDDNTHKICPIVGDLLSKRRVAVFDALVAQGTHVAMSESEKLTKIGATGKANPSIGQVFDHNWDRPEELVQLGELGSSTVRALTGGLIEQAIPVRLNRLLAPGVYDLVLVIGTTMPHEVAGFSGGAKYFFPGVAGPDLTHATHWLGALASVEQVIGRIETPIRHLIEAAADHVPAEVISLNSVVTRDEDNRLRTHALFAGNLREAFRHAAEVSRHLHIKYVRRKYKRVVAILDEHYDELWVGGKASYRLGAIIEDGGELLIYAPRLRCISETHGRMIERYGYAPLESVLELVAGSAELQANLCVAAHLAHVSYAGRRDESGRIVPRYRITLASGIDEATCRRVKLEFMDHRLFERQNYESDPDTLIVDRAGRDLYLIGENAPT